MRYILLTLLLAGCTPSTVEQRAIFCFIATCEVNNGEINKGTKDEKSNTDSTTPSSDKRTSN